MGKRSQSKEGLAGEAGTFAVSKGAFVPALESLFASSSGPVKVPERKRNTPAEIGTYVAQESSNISKSANNIAVDVTAHPALTSEGEADAGELQVPPRKRRKVNKDDEIEATYMNKLAREEEKESLARQLERSNRVQARRAVDGEIQTENEMEVDNDDASDTSASNDLLDLSDSDSDIEPQVPAVPVHESLTERDGTQDRNKRTVFLSNVCTSAIKSKTSRKQLITHLKSALLEKENEKVESIRFRSTAFDMSAGPKKAAYAKKELMDETTRNTNAYVVFSSEAAARRVASKLNGTMVLDRHVHIDSLANPTRTDNKRCVFIGNLPFVDEETAAQDSEDEDENKSKTKRPKAKLPADAEEGLWRTFSKCGKVESVRVVRDKTTRVGKGFAYVQFEDGNGVEKALLLDGKKFPPLLPRLLRVSRAKGIKKKDARARESLRGKDAHRGRRREANKRTGANGVLVDGSKRGGKLNGVVFEGYRASSANKMKFKVKGKKNRGKQDGVQPTSRSSRRGAAFRAGGGKKKRDA